MSSSEEKETPRKKDIKGHDGNGYDKNKKKKKGEKKKERDLMRCVKAGDVGDVRKCIERNVGCVSWCNILIFDFTDIMLICIVVALNYPHPGRELMILFCLYPTTTTAAQTQTQQ